MKLRKFFHSERGHPLIFAQRADEQHKLPVITVEDHLKWYTLYAVHPDGSVEPLEGPEEPTDIPPRTPINPTGCVHGDHCWHPDAVRMYAKRLGYAIDDRSLEVIAGRWFIEHLNGLSEEINVEVAW